jgi:hypothetical protein
MVAMLLHGRTTLPARVSALSPWLDSVLPDAEDLSQVRRLGGRRVLKTHTPADGFPAWAGVKLVAVYRHPLDVFLSIRKHVMNMKEAENPDLCGPLPEAVRYYIDLCGPLPEAVRYYIGGAFDADEVDRDRLPLLVEHHRRTRARASEGAEIYFFHYAAMVSDHAGAVRRLAQVLEIPHDDALIAAVARATQIEAMRADPGQFAPEGGTGFWHDDAVFFDSGGTEKWRAVLGAEETAAYEAAFAAQEPDRAVRRWLETGR